MTKKFQNAQYTRPPESRRQKKNRRKRNKRNEVNAQKHTAQSEIKHNTDARQLFINESTKYKKKKILEFNEEASVFGKGKIGNRTEFLTYVIGLIPTIIAMSLTYLSDEVYKKLYVAGGTMAVVSPTIIWVCRWSTKFANMTLGKYHREKARRISQLLTSDHAEDQCALEENCGRIYDLFHIQIEQVFESNPRWREDIQKLAVDAVDRIFNYLEQCNVLEPYYMLKGVIHGKSKLHWLKKGYNVMYRGIKTRTGDLFSEVDVRNKEDHVVFWKTRVDVPARCGWRYAFEGEEFPERPESILRSIKRHLQHPVKKTMLCAFDLSIPVVCLILLPFLPGDNTGLMIAFSVVSILYGMTFGMQSIYIHESCGDFTFVSFMVIKVIVLLANITWMITAMIMISTVQQAKNKN